MDSILKDDEGTRIQVLAPVINDCKGEHHKIFQDLIKKGFIRVRVDGNVSNLDEEFHLDKNRKHTIEVIVDRLTLDMTVTLKED